jgi:ATP-dependent exoDNAse (exonuclease V) beta subunit
MSFNDYCLRSVVEKTRLLLNDGFQYHDISVLCRSNSEASLVASFLLENQIPVISAESLLVSNSPEVRFIMSVIGVLLNDNDIISQAGIVHFLQKRGDLKGTLVEILMKFGIANKEGKSEDRKSPELFKLLAESGFFISKENMIVLPVYELCEEIIRIFQLNRKPDSGLNFFLDAVLNLACRKNTGIPELIDWWEDHRGKLSVIVPEGINALRVMTIHKSKGLEFPVVIYPFANQRVKPSKSHLWIDFDDSEFHNLRTALVNTSGVLENTEFSEIYRQEMEKSYLDLFNLLYVTFTRPTRRLYIFTGKPSEEIHSSGSVSNFISDYLKQAGFWNEGQFTYTYGSCQPFENNVLGSAEGIPFGESSYPLDEFISNSWREKVLLSHQAPEYWETEKTQTRQEWGKLVHRLLSEILSPGDIEAAIENLVKSGIINRKEAEKLSSAIAHFLGNPEISKYFEPGLSIKTETDIISPDGKIFRPDRIVIMKDTAVVIDFKTGKPSEHHQKQVKQYKNVLLNMGFNEVKGLLMYVELVPNIAEVN